jgi:two-component system C4-dicarboxylate transport response regulator DctD
MAKSTRPLVLVVDDDRDTRELYRLALDLAGYRVIDAATIADAVRVSRAEPATVAVGDWRLPDGDGLDLAAALGDLSRDTALFAVTGVTLSPADVDFAHARGFHRVMQKPVLPDALVQTVEELVEETVSRGHTVGLSPS